MKKSLIIALVFGFSVAACPSIPLPLLETLEDCKTAEEHLKDIGCIPSDRPYTLKGKSFEQFCQETIQNGINLSPRCLSEITSCDQMNSCVQR